MENLNMAEEQSTAEIFSEYARLLWHWLWLLILLAALGGTTAYFLARRQTPVYQATAIAMVSSPAAQDPYSALYTGQALGTSYATLMTTKTVMDSVAQHMGLAYLPGSIQVTPITNTQLLTVRVTDTNPKRAALTANTLVTVFSEKVQADQAARYAGSSQNLKNQMDELSQEIQTTSANLAVLGQKIKDDNTTLNALVTKNVTGLTQDELDQRTNSIQDTQSLLASESSQQAQLQVALQNYNSTYAALLQSYNAIQLTEDQSSSGILLKDAALPPGSPIQPQPLRSGMLAAVIGLFVGAGIVFLIEFLNDSLRDPQEITRKWGIPLLGMIVNIDLKNENELITEREPRAPISEAFRSLRTNLQFASIDSPLHSILITSPSPEDGKTFVAGNLACVFAQGGRKVIAMDADLRKPRLHRFFQLPNRIGLSDQFINTKALSDGAIQPTKVKNLDFLASGSLPPNPSELISSPKMVEIIQTLESQYELVFIDAPPSLLVTDANMLANRANGVLLVISPTVTKRTAIKNTIEQMMQVKANIFGVVLNGVDLRKTHYNYYRGYYRRYRRDYVYGTAGMKRDEIT